MIIYVYRSFTLHVPTYVLNLLPICSPECLRCGPKLNKNSNKKVTLSELYFLYNSFFGEAITLKQNQFEIRV